MTAQQTVVDTIANNLANINTVGFKRSQVDFQDLMYLKLREAGTETVSGVRAPTGFEIGSGVRPASTLKVFSQGEVENTGRDLDVAIMGDGFFQVTVAGVTRYTRDGALRVNDEGQLVTASGYYLEPPITIPSDTRAISIGEDGTINVLTGTESTPQQIGQLQLVRFINPSGLSSEGGNLLSETAGSGPAITGTAGRDGFGLLRQNFLERSNVQMVSELVNLITAQRAYEINSRAIRAGDDMLQTANRLIS